MEPKFMELLGSIPTSWDTTIIVDAKVGNYIITARRKANDWFVAGMTDSSARDIKIDLSFLNEGNYIATICSDGINANRNAMDYAIEEKTLAANDNLQIHMAPAGGFLVSVRKK
jgi:alpha-glucosidase